MSKEERIASAYRAGYQWGSKAANKAVKSNESFLDLIKQFTSAVFNADALRDVLLDHEVLSHMEDPWRQGMLDMLKSYNRLPGMRENNENLRGLADDWYKNAGEE